MCWMWETAEPANPWGIERHDNLAGVAIPKTEIIQWKWMIDPDQPWRGQGALVAAASDIDLANEIRAYIYALLKNDARPPIVVNLAEGDDYDEDRADRLRAQWKEKYGGDNRGLPAFLEFGMTVNQLGYNLQQLQIDSLRDGPDVAICQGFGIQPNIIGALVGLKTSGVQANFQEAREMLTELTLIPLWRSFSSEVQQAMADEQGYGRDIRIRFDLTQVRALLDKQEKVREWTLNAYNASGITRAEFRQTLGYQTTPADEVYKETLTTVYTQAGQMRITAESQPAKFLLPAHNKQEEQTGVMVAFFLPPLFATDLATAVSGLLGAVPASEYHMTLVYLGEKTAVDRALLLRVVEVFARDYAPINGRLNGTGRFDPENDTTPFYANMDAQRLPAFRQALIERLAAVGIASASEHGYTPHITLAYLPANAPMPTITLPDSAVFLNLITVAYGNERYNFPMLGSKTAVTILDYKNGFPQGDNGASNRRAAIRQYERQGQAARVLKAVRAKLEPLMESAVSNYFANFAKRTESAILGSKADMPLTTAEMQKILSLIFQQEEAKELEDIIQRYQLSITSESWQTFNLMVNSSIRFDMNDPVITELLGTAGGRVKNISDSTRQQLQELLQYGNENGWTIDNIIKGDANKPGIRKFIEETYAGRARTIARTELGTAQQMAAYGRFKGAGADGVIVFDNGVDDSHPVCTQLDGTVQTLAWAEKTRYSTPTACERLGRGLMMGRNNKWQTRPQFCKT